MKPQFPFRLEWISLVYLTLFVLAVLSPSIIRKDILGLEQAHVEEFLIFLFGLVGLMTFGLYQRYMEHKEEEHQQAVDAYERAKRELVDSYQYIGSINRKIEVLKGVANQTSLNVRAGSTPIRELLVSLVANAASCIGAKSALLRYVELNKLRTDQEILHHAEATPFRVANKELRKLYESGVSHAFVKSEEGREILIIPSDHRDNSIKAYLLIEVDPTQTMDVLDTSLLKVFANQAELLYHGLPIASNEANDPLTLVEQAQRSVSGDVS